MVTKAQIIERLTTIEDPELFLDIWFLGLIYNIQIEPFEDENRVVVDMTFTSPMCPAGPQLTREVHEKIMQLDGVGAVKVNVVFTPPWQPSDEVKLTLGLI